MSIILMRHGKPDHPPGGRLPALAMEQWCEAYDMSLVEDTPPDRCRQIVGTADYIVTSPLPRARSSLAKLDREPALIDELFGEVSLPVMRLVILIYLSVILIYLLLSGWLCFALCGCAAMPDR